MVIDRYMAIDNVCAWPSLSVLPNGDVGALVFNRPSHGGIEGDVELWVSPGGKAPWGRRSVVTAHEPGTVRMNVAGGVSGDGTLVALVSGWDIRFPRPIRTDNILPEVQVCVSHDEGRTWDRNGRFSAPPGSGRFMPFGKLVDTGAAWLAAAYDCRMANVSRESRLSSSWIFASTDRGRSWSARGLIGPDRFTETDILPVTGGWIAAARTLQDASAPGDPHSSPWVRLMHGSADATAWTPGESLSVPGQHPAHLLRLRDGRIVFSCGSRVPGFFGVLARISADEGKRWSAPVVLASDVLSSDQGYPSSVELEDGTILTAYYTKGSQAHHRYHMATVSWRPE